MILPKTGKGSRKRFAPFHGAYPRQNGGSKTQPLAALRLGVSKSVAMITDRPNPLLRNEPK